MSIARFPLRSISIAVSCALLAFPALETQASSISEFAKFGDRSMFQVVYLGEGDQTPDGDTSAANIATDYEVIHSATISGIQYWTDILGPKAQNSQPAVLYMGLIPSDSAGVQNAFAWTWDVPALTGLIAEGASYNPTKDYSVTLIGQFMGASEEKYPNADRTHASQLGWYVNAETSIPTNEAQADLVGTVRHELGHALGIGTDVDKTKAATFVFYSDDVSSWTQHLYGANGVQAKAGMVISKDPASDSFYLPEDGVATFKGEHVSEVLGNVSLNGSLAGGLPVNGWERGYPELSHLQTTGMMSHRVYSNYTSFMEVELAVMQDIGYQLDRKAYFGRSIYADGQTVVNTQGYSARNEAGTAYTGAASTVPLGVGLHIYGSRNTVTQAADINTAGTGAVGIRIDGVGNSLTLPSSSTIHSDGVNGIGLLVAYGRDHTVNIGGTVTARGSSGNALQFDFGSSSNGSFDDYRGSYIRYTRNVATDGSIDYQANLRLLMTSSYWNSQADELVGPMVKEATVTGNLVAAGNAVYIGKNAFVQTVNVTSGARIQGNITSDWMGFNTDSGSLYEGLKIQYGSNSIVPGTYCQDLVTTLNFGGSGTRVDGVITGEKNLRVKVLEGSTVSINSASASRILGLTVEQGATLKGNASYAITQNFATDGNSANDGKMVLSGTLAPGNSIGTISLDGDLVMGQTGKLDLEFGKDGNDKLIIHNGTIENYDASRLSFVPLTTGLVSEKRIAIDPRDFIVLDGDFDFGTLTELNIEENSPTLMYKRVAGDKITYFDICRDFQSYARGRNGRSLALMLEEADLESDGKADGAFKDSAPANDFESLILALDNSSPDGSDVRSALRQMQPTLYGNVAQANFDYQRLLSGSLERDPGACAGKGVSAFARTFASHSHRSHGYMEFRTKDAGVLFGSSIWGDRWDADIYAAANHRKLTTRNRSSANINGFYAGVRGSIHPAEDSGLVLMGDARIGFDSVSGIRSVRFAGYSSQIRKDYTALAGYVRLGAGYDFPLSALTVTPLAAIDCSGMRQPGISEDADKGAALGVAARTFSSSHIAAGLKVSSRIPLSDDRALKFVGKASASHELLRNAGTMKLRLRNLEDGSFSFRTGAPGHTSYGIRGRMSVDAKNWRFSLNVGTELYGGSGYNAYGYAGAAWKF